MTYLPDKSFDDQGLLRACMQDLVLKENVKIGLREKKNDSDMEIFMWKNIHDKRNYT